MKVVINKCFGGFSLSAKAVRRLAELKGRKCFFFSGYDKPYTPISDKEAEKEFAVTAFDVPNPNVLQDDDWYREAEKEFVVTAFDVPNPNVLQDDDWYRKHSLYFRDIDRADPDLIRVIEELGAGHRTGASGSCAELEIVEIPDGTNYEIAEYDGNEHIAEVHRTWG